MAIAIAMLIATLACLLSFKLSYPQSKLSADASVEKYRIGFVINYMNESQSLENPQTVQAPWIAAERFCNELQGCLVSGWLRLPPYTLNFRPSRDDPFRVNHDPGVYFRPDREYYVLIDDPSVVWLDDQRNISVMSQSDRENAPTRVIIHEDELTWIIEVDTVNRRYLIQPDDWLSSGLMVHLAVWVPQ